MAQHFQMPTIWWRVIELAFALFSVTAAALCALLVLYASGDWLLLTFAILLLAGVGFFGRHTVPRFYEQARLVLNLGSVREGERLNLLGSPWHVKRLHVFFDLINPSLTGGRLRLPLRDVLTLVSRRFEKAERWFPCEEGDWILLDDQFFGRVTLQTPDVVQAIPLGGAPRRIGPRRFSKIIHAISRWGFAFPHDSSSTTGTSRSRRPVSPSTSKDASSANCSSTSTTSTSQTST